MRSVFAKRIAVITAAAVIAVGFLIPADRSLAQSCKYGEDLIG